MKTHDTIYLYIQYMSIPHYKYMYTYTNMTYDTTNTCISTHLHIIFIHECSQC